VNAYHVVLLHLLAAYVVIVMLAWAAYGSSIAFILGLFMFFGFAAGRSLHLARQDDIASPESEH